MDKGLLDLGSLWDRLVAWVEPMLSGSNWHSLLLLWATIAIAACVTYWRSVRAERSLRDFLRFSVPSVVFTHPSARTDFIFWVARHITSPLLVTPFAITAATTGYSVHVIAGYFGFHPHVVDAPSTWVVVAFTISMLIAADLSYYIYHVAQHNIGFMWELHKVHHSAEVMVGITKDRIHPLDMVMNNLWDGVIPGLVFGLWALFVMSPTEVAVFGINAYVLRNILMMDFVRHTHLPFDYGKYTSMILLPPFYHHVHHSVDPKDYNRNYGLLLSVWDRMFGTLKVPEPGRVYAFGLSDDEAREYQSLYGVYVLPLQKIVRMWLPPGGLRRRVGARQTGAIP